MSFFVIKNLSSSMDFMKNSQIGEKEVLDKKINLGKN